MSTLKSNFTAETISDQKRFVRGEHWLAVRTFLRRRDHVHHAKWRIMTLAGGNPAEEMGCIRELMPKAHVIAVDTDPACLERAIDAGADDVVCVDVLAWDQTPYAERLRRKTRLPARVPPIIGALGAFDVINLDLCGGVNPDVQEAVMRYAEMVKGGALMMTCSYGRDVVEAFNREPLDGVPESVAMRLRYVNERKPYYMRLSSVMAYKGREMPMMAVLWVSYNDAPDQYSFVKVDPGDLALACAYPNVAPLYGLPQERVLAFRRQMAAAKAHATRREKGVANG